MASPTRWTWVWVNSRSWWWTGSPGVLQFMGSRRVGHDWATEMNWNYIRKLTPKGLCFLLKQKGLFLKVSWLTFHNAPFPSPQTVLVGKTFIYVLCSHEQVSWWILRSTIFISSSCSRWVMRGGLQSWCPIIGDDTYEMAMQCITKTIIKLWQELGLWGSEDWLLWHYREQNDDKLLTEKAKVKHLGDQLSTNGKLSREIIEPW